MVLAGQASASLRRLLVSILGVFAWTFACISAVSTALDAAYGTNEPAAVRGLMVTAAIVAMVDLVIIAMFLTAETWRRSSSNYRIAAFRYLYMVVIFCISFSLLSVSLTVATLISLKSHYAWGNGMAPAASWTTRKLPIQFTILGLAALAQVLFYSMAILYRNGPDGTESATVSALRRRESVISETRDTTPRGTLEFMSRPYCRHNSGHSSTASNASSQSLNSWRSSFQQAVRPMTSRSKLLARPGLSRDSKSSLSDARSVEEASQFDGFDLWDTSNVDPSVKDSLMTSAPSRGTVLETIPGSRPASPARALDGPFPSSALDEDIDILEPPRALSDASRSPSPDLDESHIHPLFRTDSPTPPPAASPGTVVLASPMSGQVIARPYNRTRSNSRTASPSLFSSPRVTSEDRKRSPSSASRTITPPIPQSILTPSVVETEH